MAKCWTCGSSVSGYHYECSFCKDAIRELESIQETISGGVEDLARIQKYGFDQLSDQLSEIATVIEWGFEELSWQLQQQTDVLRSIDHTLKTPSETKANEWRLHAEELRRRGVLEESEEFFLKAFSEYRLDYRIYVGLAKTYIRLGKFNEAKVFLEKSLPHAPQEDNIDYKSYSYRLIGHIYACEGDYIEALDSLHSSIKLFPDYANGLYDFAQYASLVSDEVIDRVCSQTFRQWGHNWQRAVELKNYNLVCHLALAKAIKSKPIYFYLAEKERNFEPRKSMLQSVLENKLSNARGELESIIVNTKGISEDVEKYIPSALRALSKSKDNKELESTKIYEEVKSKLKIAKDKMASGDYMTFLEAVPIAEEAFNLANTARFKAGEERERYERRRTEKVKNAWKRVPGAIIGWPLLFGILGTIGGCTVGLVLDTSDADIGFILGSGFILGMIGGLIFGIYNIQKELQ